jgi:D-alanyl-D-alanine carboxypeptidase
VAEADTPSRGNDAAQVASSATASAEPAMAALTPAAPRPAAKASLMAAAAAALPPPPARVEATAKPEPKSEPAPLTSGVIQSQPMAIMPGSAEPMKPVKVKTVQVKAGGTKLASAGPSQPAPTTNAIPARPEVAETSSAVVASAEGARTAARTEMPQQPAGFGTGNGILGVLPASSLQQPTSAPQTVAAVQPQAMQPAVVAKPAQSAVHSGWVIQVGALESEDEARQRIDLARNQSRGLLGKADPFTEVVSKDNRKLYRARFAGLEREQAEAVCRALKRADISCITIRN